VDKPIDLIPLVCLKCGTSVPAEIDEVAWVCGQCGQGLVLDEEAGLAPLEVHYSAGIAPNARGKPYWVAEGRVTIQQRWTYGSAGRQADESTRFWAQSHRFFVPAYACTLEALLSTGMDLLLQPPDLQPGPAARFEPAILPAEHVHATAEFIVMAVEAGRKDKLKSVDFALQLTTPGLWILP